MKNRPLALPILLLPGLLLLLAPQSLHAGSATWNLNPTSGDWNTAANWSSGTVPNSLTDVATFSVSNMTQVSLSQVVSVGGITFDVSANAFTITPQPGTSMQFFGAGISNLSQEMQNFVSPVDGGSSGFYIFNGAPFGVQTITGLVTFTQEARNTDSGDTGFVEFRFGALAGDATFHNLGATVAGGAGGLTYFVGSDTSADESTIINEGATVALATGGASSFEAGHPTAGNATLIANAGSNGGGGGTFTFFGASTGGTARVELFGNGYLDLSAKMSDDTTFSIGSIEGDGQVYLGKVNCSVGSNNLSTTFSGVLHPGSPTGGSGACALTKIGSGTLTLSGANLYTAGTTISAGTLVINNTTGSGTGTGAVQVNAGTLGGSGIIAGAVTVGTGSGTGAFLAPAAGTNVKATFTTQSGLTFNADATYTYTFKAQKKQARTDKVVVNGVTINGGSFAFQGTAQGTLRQGLVLTAISNTSANPIGGTFANLPDGAILTVNGNTFQASYEGGDGNDLTLTVVP